MHAGAFALRHATRLPSAMGAPNERMEMHDEWFMALKYLAAKDKPKTKFAIGLGIGVDHADMGKIIAKLMDLQYIELFDKDHYVITAHGLEKVKVAALSGQGTTRGPRLRQG
jgi:hypothetical protein